MNIKQTVSQSTVARYIITGGGSFVFEFSVLFGLKHAGLSNEWAVGISYWVGLTVSFVLQKFITFEDTDKSAKRVGRQLFLYGILVAINYAFAITFTSWLATHINFYLARVVALLITTFFNFYAYKSHIFGTKKQEEGLDPFDPNPLIK
jgi:putative flippase GtrA